MYFLLLLTYSKRFNSRNRQYCTLPYCKQIFIYFFLVHNIYLPVQHIAFKVIMISNLRMGSIQMPADLAISALISPLGFIRSHTIFAIFLHISFILHTWFNLSTDCALKLTHGLISNRIWKKTNKQTCCPFCYSCVCVFSFSLSIIRPFYSATINSLKCLHNFTCISVSF